MVSSEYSTIEPLVSRQPPNQLQLVNLNFGLSICHGPQYS